MNCSLFQKVIHRPSIGRYTKLEEPKARESLLTPSMRSSSSSSTPISEKEMLKTSAPAPSLHLTANPPPLVDLEAKSPGSEPEIFSPMKKVQAANAALLLRPSFTIDDAKDDEDDEDATSDAGADDDQVMDEVGGLVL
jgi:hypothetical protein